MGYSEGRSMLYLEARCLMMVKGAGSQGVQNGSIACIALPESLPGGVRGVLAENLLATCLGLEVASGNDALASHSDIRKTAKLMLQFLPGTDFITSGYSAMPKRDNLFGGGNFDAEDLDDWLVLQRDMQVDGRLVPVREDAVIAMRELAARALQAVYAELGFPPITDDEVAAAAVAHSSDDMPDRDVAADLAAADALPCRAADCHRRDRRPGQARFPRHSGEGPRDAAAAADRRLCPDFGDLRRALECAQRDQRSERLSRPRQRLPAVRRALAQTDGSAAVPGCEQHGRAIVAQCPPAPRRAGARGARQRPRSRDCARAGVRHGDECDAVWARPRGGPAGTDRGRRRRRHSRAGRQGLSHGGLRRYRARVGATERLRESPWGSSPRARP